MDETLRLWGRNIRNARKSRRWTLDELGEAVGVSAATISRWENARSEPTRRHKARLAAVLGQDVSLLFPLTRSAA